MFEQVFLSPQVKRSEIISNKLVCPKNARIRILGNKKISCAHTRKKKKKKYQEIPKLHRIITQCLALHPEIKILSALAKIS